jgi:hypothetical protein
MTQGALIAAQWLCSVVVLAEALNKLERADLFAGRVGLHRLWAARWLLAPWWWQRCHVVTAFKVLGWALLAVGAGGGLMAPFLAGMPPPSLHEVAFAAGFASLIVRSRIKEG